MVKGIAILFTVFIIAIIIMLFVLYSKTVGVYMYNLLYKAFYEHSNDNSDNKLKRQERDNFV